MTSVASPVIIDAFEGLSVNFNDTSFSDQWVIGNDVSNNFLISYPGATGLLTLTTGNDLIITSSTSTAGNITTTGSISRGNGVLCAIDTAGGQTVSASPTWTPVNFNSAPRIDDCFTFTATDDEIVIDVAGWYEIDADVSTVISAGTPPVTTNCRLTEDTSEIPGTFRSGNNLSLTNGVVSLHTHTIRQFSASTSIALEVTFVGAMDTVETVPNGTQITIKRV